MKCAFCKKPVTLDDSWAATDNPSVRWCNDENKCLTNWYEYLTETVERVGEKAA